MATQANIRALASVGSLVTVVSILTSSTVVRQTVARLFSPSAHPFRFASLCLALFLNAKSFPLIWHVRFFRLMIYQLYFQPTPLPQDALFRPIVTTSMYTPIPEVDFNLHKSNSTYFADADMARTQLVACLLRKGIRDARAGRHREYQLPSKDVAEVHAVGEANGTPTEANGTAKGTGKKEPKQVFAIALGAVSCHFKREIKPYARFDIWTRILSWDQKWVYMISHLVKSGAVPPEEWSLQPWKVPKGRKMDKTNLSSEERRAKWKDAIYATSISKYVVKRGRQTVPPELVFEYSDLLPPRPGQESNDNMKKTASGSATAPVEWTWEKVEQERVRGLEIAGKFGALDAPGGLHDEFPIAGGPDGMGNVGVLGEFKDLYL